jgi:hypothetical protein
LYFTSNQVTQEASSLGSVEDAEGYMEDTKIAAKLRSTHTRLRVTPQKHQLHIQVCTISGRDGGQVIHDWKLLEVKILVMHVPSILGDEESRPLQIATGNIADQDHHQPHSKATTTNGDYQAAH